MAFLGIELKGVWADLFSTMVGFVLGVSLTWCWKRLSSRTCRVVFYTAYWWKLPKSYKEDGVADFLKSIFLSKRGRELLKQIANKELKDEIFYLYAFRQTAFQEYKERGIRANKSFDDLFKEFLRCILSATDNSPDMTEFYDNASRQPTKKEGWCHYKVWVSVDKESFELIKKIREKAIEDHDKAFAEEPHLSARFYSYKWLNCDISDAMLISAAELGMLDEMDSVNPEHRSNRVTAFVASLYMLHAGISSFVSLTKQSIQSHAEIDGAVFRDAMLDFLHPDGGNVARVTGLDGFRDGRDIAFAISRICRAVVSRREFILLTNDVKNATDDERKKKLSEILFSASLGRLLVAAAPYPDDLSSGNRLSINDIAEWHKVYWQEPGSEFRPEKLSDAMHHIAPLVLSCVVKKIKRSTKEDQCHQLIINSKLQCFFSLSESCVAPKGQNELLGEFSYLLTAYEENIYGECRFLLELVRPLFGGSSRLVRYLGSFEKLSKEQTPIDSSSSKHYKEELNPFNLAVLLADSGLKVLSDVDMATSSSSEITRRLLNSIVALCKASAGVAPGMFDKAVDYLVKSAIAVRSQLSTLHRLHEIIAEYKSKENRIDPEGLLKSIESYREQWNNDREKAGKNAATLLKKLSAQSGKTDGKSWFYLFGYGGPVSTMISHTKDDPAICFVSAPLRPIGEAHRIELWDKTIGFLQKRFYLIPDELISKTLAGKLPGVEKPKAVIMGCEAFDKQKNVINSSGCLALAILANATGVPFWVVTEGSKREESLPEDIVTVPAGQFLRYRCPQEASAPDEKWPVSERVDGGFITRIITEETEAD